MYNDKRYSLDWDIEDEPDYQTDTTAVIEKETVSFHVKDLMVVVEEDGDTYIDPDSNPEIVDEAIADEYPESRDGITIEVEFKTGESTFVELEDMEDTFIHMETLLQTALPSDAGLYRVSGKFTLAYKIYGDITYYSVSDGRDYYEYDEPEFELSSNWIPAKSSITDVTYAKVE